MTLLATDAGAVVSGGSTSALWPTDATLLATAKAQLAGVFNAQTAALGAAQLSATYATLTGSSSTAGSIAFAIANTAGAFTSASVASLASAFGLTYWAAVNNGAYVSAAVSAGYGSVAGTGTITTPSVPSVPTGVTASVATGNKVTISWTAPASGGSTITGYTVVASGGTLAGSACTTPNLNTVALSGTNNLVITITGTDTSLSLIHI